MRSGLLLSGGQDSLAVAYWKQPDVGITVDYGQSAVIAEIKVSREVCKNLAIPHEVIRVDCSEIFSGELFGKAPALNAPYPDWTPFRNQFLTTIAAIRAMDLNIQILLSGQVSSDASHVDGTKEFISAMNNLFSIQEGKLQLIAPAINLSTVELVRKSNVPKSVFAMAHSCQRSNIPCGVCRGCVKHNSVLEALGFSGPILK